MGVDKRTNTKSNNQTPELAQWLCILLCLLALCIYLAAIPFYYNATAQICTSAAASCAGSGQLTQSQAELLAAHAITPEFWAWYNLVVRLIITAINCGIAILIFIRKRDDRMALLTALTLFMMGCFIPPDIIDQLALGLPRFSLPIYLMQGLGASLWFLFLAVFPSGRFVPRAIRLVVLYLAFLVFSGYFLPPEFSADSLLGGLSFLSWLLPLTLLILAQVYRYWRVSNPIERQETRWVLFGFVLFLLFLLGSFISTNIADQSGGTDPAATTSAMLANQFFAAIQFTLIYLIIGLSVGMAILRSRLFDIDIIINRALVYGSLTAILAAIYFGSVVVLQQLLYPFTGSSDFTIILSTLAIAALFNPIRIRVQAIIDRIFYRRKYDAAKTLAAFSTRLRDEVDLPALADDIVHVVHTTLQPNQVTLWLRNPDTGKNPTPEDQKP